MGLHVDCSMLSQDECCQIIGVIAKDISLRRHEQERVRKLRKEFEKTRKEITLKSSKWRSLDHNCLICGRYLHKYFCFFQRGEQCLACEHMACSTCRRALVVDEEDKHYLCFLCVEKRDIQRKSFQWFYEMVEHRFKRFGSAKVLRGIQKVNKTDPRVVTLIGLTREMTYVGSRFSSRSSSFKSSLIFSEKNETPSTSLTPSESSMRSRTFSRSKSTEDLPVSSNRPKRYLHSRKSSLPEKLQLIQKDPEKEISVRSLEVTVEEKSDASSGNSGFEVISLAASPSAGTNVEKASFTFKFFGNAEFIVLASAAMVLAFFLSVLACVGYIDEYYVESEEEDKPE